jgi:hypothetical protein
MKFQDRSRKECVITYCTIGETKIWLETKGSATIELTFSSIMLYQSSNFSIN